MGFDYGCPYGFLEKYTPSRLYVSENLSSSISEYLPKTVDELLDLNVDLPEYPRFVQSVSKSLPTADKNSLLPVFIVPGLGLSRVQPLIGKIMHPVYCAEFPGYVNSVENAALSLIWVSLVNGLEIGLKIAFPRDTTRTRVFTVGRWDLYFSFVRSL